VEATIGSGPARVVIDVGLAAAVLALLDGALGDGGCADLAGVVGWFAGATEVAGVAEVAGAAEMAGG